MCLIIKILIMLKVVSFLGTFFLNNSCFSHPKDYRQKLNQSIVLKDTMYAMYYLQILSIYLKLRCFIFL